MSLWTEIFAPGEEARGRELDAKIAAEQRAMLERGRWTEEQFYEASLNTQANAASMYDKQIGDAFKEGLADGAAGLKKDLTIGGLAIGTLALIAGGLWIAWHMGLFNRPGK